MNTNDCSITSAEMLFVKLFFYYKKSDRENMELSSEVILLYLAVSETILRTKQRLLKNVLWLNFKVSFGHHTEIVMLVYFLKCMVDLISITPKY